MYTRFMSPVFIVGVLNTTPDSYFDGGNYDQIESAVDRAIQMIEEGADIITDTLSNRISKTDSE